MCNESGVRLIRACLYTVRPPREGHVEGLEDTSRASDVEEDEDMSSLVIIDEDVLDEHLESGLFLGEKAVGLVGRQTAAIAWMQLPRIRLAPVNGLLNKHGEIVNRQLVVLAMLVNEDPAIEPDGPFVAVEMQQLGPTDGEARETFVRDIVGNEIVWVKGFGIMIARFECGNLGF